MLILALSDGLQKALGHPFLTNQYKLEAPLPHSYPPSSPPWSLNGGEISTRPHCVLNGRKIINKVTLCSNTDTTMALLAGLAFTVTAIAHCQVTVIPVYCIFI